MLPGPGRPLAAPPSIGNRHVKAFYRQPICQGKLPAKLLSDSILMWWRLETQCGRQPHWITLPPNFCHRERADDIRSLSPQRHGLLTDKPHVSHYQIFSANNCWNKDEIYRMRSPLGNGLVASSGSTDWSFRALSISGTQIMICFRCSWQDTFSHVASERRLLQRVLHTRNGIVQVINELNLPACGWYHHKTPHTSFCLLSTDWNYYIISSS